MLTPFYIRFRYITLGKRYEMLAPGSLLKGGHGLMHEFSLFETLNGKRGDIDRDGVSVQDQFGDYFSHCRAMLKPMAAKTVGEDKSFNSGNSS